MFRLGHRLLVHFRVAMIAFLLCSISLSSWISPVSAASAPGNIDIIEPHPNSLVGDYLFLGFNVNSDVPLATLQASVGDLQTSLNPESSCGRSCDPEYSVRFDLRSLPAGAATVVVEAVDVDGGTITASLPFIHDAPPTIDIVSPVPNAVAEPDLELDLSCTDDGAAGCMSLEVSVEKKTIASGQNRIGQTVSLAEYDGQQVMLFVTATDDRGQRGVRTIPVYVDEHPLLQKTDTVRGLILDSDEDRILYFDAYAHAIRIAHRGLTTEEELPVKVGETPGVGYLTSHGATVEARDETSGKLSLMEWRNGSLIQHERSFRSAGAYAVYNLANNPDQANTTYRKVLEKTDNGEITFIESSLKGNWDHVVNENGVVVYSKTISNFVQLYKFAGGSGPIKITPDPNANYRGVMIDGDRIIALKTDKQGTAIGLVLLENGTETVLPGTQRSKQPGTDYLVSGGWTAYKKLTEQGQVQLWVRSPEGEEVQLTPASTANSKFNALGPNGDVAYTYSGRLLLSKNESAGRSEPVDLSQANAKAFWSEGAWHVRLGGSQYDVLGSKPEEPKLERIVVEPSSLELAAGTTETLQVLAHYTDGSSRDVTVESVFESADPEIAAVSSDGHIDAVSEGSTVIGVRYESMEATVPVQVIQDNPTDPGDPDNPDNPGNPNPETDMFKVLLKKLLRTMLSFILASDLWREFMDSFSPAGQPDALNEFNWE